VFSAIATVSKDVGFESLNVLPKAPAVHLVKALVSGGIIPVKKNLKHVGKRLMKWTNFEAQKGL